MYQISVLYGRMELLSSHMKNPAKLLVSQGLKPWNECWLILSGFLCVKNAKDRADHLRIQFTTG